MERTVVSAITTGLSVIALLLSLCYPFQDFHRYRFLFGESPVWSDTTMPEQANFSIALYPSKHITELTVKSFHQKIMKANEKKVFMVAFVDPWSSEYKKYGMVIEDAAKLLHDSSISSEEAEVCIVNLAVNNYLAMLYVPPKLQVETWNDDQVKESFRFGRPNSSPLVVTLFRNKKQISTHPHSAYASLLTPQRLFDYVQYYAHHLSRIDDIETLERFRASKESTVELCGYAVAECDSSAAGVFVKSGKALEGQVNLVIVSNETLCHEPCRVSLYRKQELVRFISRPTPAQLQGFIRANTGNFLKELTGSKLSRLEKTDTFLCIALIDPENNTDWTRIESALRLSRDFLIDRESIQIRYAWGRPETLLKLFGITEASPPALLLYHLNERKFSMMKSPDADAEHIFEWVAALVQHPERLEHRKKDSKPESEDEEEESPVKGSDLPWHAQLHTEEDFKNMKFKELWHRLRFFQMQHAQVEEVFQNLPLAKQNREVALRTNLNMFRDFLSSDPDGVKIRPVLNYLPPNSQVLENSLSSSPESRRVMLRTVEMYSEARELYRQKIEVEEDEDFHRRVYRTVHYLQQLLANILVQRSKEFIESEEFSEELAKPLTVDRRVAKELSYEEFLRKYAAKGVPVILTNISLFKTPLTLDRLVEVCGNKRVDLAFKDGEHIWAGLSEAPDFGSLEEFLTGFSTNETLRKYYLHDWSLTTECPEILGLHTSFDEFIMPKFFAGDYFQRMPYNEYENSWPSLFVGAKGTGSGVHVDNGGTNFWLYLISGEKRWRIFDRASMLNLYFKPGYAHIYTDVFRPDLKEYPLFRQAKMYEVTQKPGELVFIPGDFPHAVMNTEDSVGVSANYIDESNLYRFLWHSLVQARLRKFEMFTHPGFPLKSASDNHDVTFGEYKSKNWFNHHAPS